MRMIRSCGTLVIGLCCAVLFGADATTSEPTLKSGIDRAGFDTSLTPGNDFYDYVNGTWIKNNPIPAEFGRWGAFEKLADDTRKHLHEIVEDLAHDDALPPNDNRRKIRDFYRTAMDEAKLNQLGAAPLSAEFDKIAKIDSTEDLIARLGDLRAGGHSMLFSFGVGRDEKLSSHHACYLSQDGLGLPERDYYVGKTEDSKKIREQYRAHVAKMLELLGDKPEVAAAEADAVLRIETRLAEASRSPVKLNDREANYNRMSVPDLKKLTPKLNWDLYWKPLELPEIPYVIVGQPEFFERVNELLGDTPAADWRAYLRWHLIHATASYLSDPFEQENFHFYSATMRGTKEMQPRWKRAVGALEGHLGQPLGQLYVERYFPPAAKKRMDELVKNIAAAYRERIEAVDWMGPQTKQQALAKLATVLPKIGYPDKWRDFSGLKVETDSYVQNVMRAQAFNSRYGLSKLGQPVDRTEWGMAPSIVNAYYNPTANEIVFPAGILQPPFFDLSADDAINYGSIGMVISHEITHGFDDQGSRSDGEGNLKNWWTDEDRARFNAKTDLLVKQYDACEVVDGLHVNGRLTISENLADLGGIMIAYTAYQRSLGGKPAPVLDGFTGPQRFFIGYAQIWRSHVRPEEQKLRLRTDGHSPPRFRVLVPLTNFQAFYDAFDVKPEDKLYRKPEDRVQVW